MSRLEKPCQIAASAAAATSRCDVHLLYDFKGGSVGIVVSLLAAKRLVSLRERPTHERPTLLSTQQRWSSDLSPFVMKPDAGWRDDATSYATLLGPQRTRSINCPHPGRPGFPFRTTWVARGPVGDDLDRQLNRAAALRLLLDAFCSHLGSVTPLATEQ
jgi:hypothetical protein